MAKEMKRVLRENTTVDTQTGEVLKRETTVQFSKEPGFVKLYFDCLGVYIKNDGLSASLNDMLLEVLHRASYAQDGQIVHLGAYDKEQICKATHKSMRRLEQAITTWVKNRVLIRVARGIYQVNPFIFGRGDWRDIANLRATFNFSEGSVTVTRDYKDGHYEELDTQNTSETHEDALEGASEQEQSTGTPVTFPTKFSERMRAAMFPQQNLKRREALFCWARRRFAPAKCRNALLLSSKSAKLSFSQEKLLTTHCHEPAHISHQWTCESVSGSHLRKRSDEENPQRCYDPSDDRDGTAGVPSTQPV